MRTREQVQAEYSDDWFSPKAFGREFGGVGADKVREMIADGLVEALNIRKPGQRPEYRIHRTELERLLAERTVNAGVG